MKRADLIKIIEAFGCELVRNGGKHDWYQIEDRERHRLHHVGKCLMLPAKVLQDFGTSELVQPAASHHAQAPGLWGYIAAILILFAVICRITACLRGEGVPRLALIVLLLINLFLAFLIV